MSPKKTADQTADDLLFDQTAANPGDNPDEAPVEPDVTPETEGPSPGAQLPPAPAADPTTGEVIAPANDGEAPVDPPSTGIDFEALRQRQIAQREAAANQTSAEPTSGGDFFINMGEADKRLEPMAIGTRLVVSCTKADAQISGAGNPMLVLRVKVERVISTMDAKTDTRGYKNRTVRDNLLFIPPDPDSDYRGTIWRANKAMRAFGVEPDKGIYKTKAAFMGMLNRQADLLRGCVCIIEVGIDDGTKNGTQPPAIDPATGEAYPPKNTIINYLPYQKPVAQAASGETSAGVDDLPF